MRFSTTLKAAVLWLAIVGSGIAGCHYAFAHPINGHGGQRGVGHSD